MALTMTLTDSWRHGEKRSASLRVASREERETETREILRMYSTLVGDARMVTDTPAKMSQTLTATLMGKRVR